MIVRKHRGMKLNVLGLGLAGTASLIAVAQPPVQDLDSESAVSWLQHEIRYDVRNERFIQMPNSDVVIRLWDQKSETGLWEAKYAIASDGKSYRTDRTTNASVLLRHGVFDPLMSTPEIHPKLTADNNNTVHIVQFVCQPLDEFRGAIAESGGTIYKFLANNSYIVDLPSDAVDVIASLPYVRWVGPFHPAYKLDEQVFATHFPYNSDEVGTAYDKSNLNPNDVTNDKVLGAEGELQDSEIAPMTFTIQVHERGPRQKAIVAQHIKQLGGRIDHHIKEGFLIRATLNLAQLETVLHMNEVAFIDPWGPPELDMNIAREIGGGNFIESTLGFTGQGVRGECFDSGMRTTHVDFQDPPLIMHGENYFDTWHGTAVTGIVFASGIGNSNGRGMLPDGQAIGAAFSKMTNRYTHTAELVDPSDIYRVVFQTNSWGDPRTTQYNSVSMEMDDILFRSDLLTTQSQSNSGWQDSRPQAWAKNMVSVGGFYHQNTLTRDDDSWNGGGSTGPAADGRLKPDLSHFYDNIFTTENTCDTCYMSDFGGTSGATPIVAGHFGLMFQMWHEGVFPGFGGAADVFDSRPHMSTAKALLINTASAVGFTGTNSDMTRTHQGWGIPDLEAMVGYSDTMFIVNESDLLSNLDSAVYSVEIQDGAPELRATLVYTDLAGTTSSSQHRINDLTLKVTSPGGTIYYGNNGLAAGNWSTSDGSPNTKDTVENVFVENPQTGSWTIEVWAAEINEDSHVETPEVDADFALIVSGIGDNGNEPFTLDIDQLIAGQATTVEVINGIANTNVYFTYSTTGLGSWYVPLLDVTLEIANPLLAGSTLTDGSGAGSLVRTIPANMSGDDIWMQAIQFQRRTNVIADTVQ